MLALLVCGASRLMPLLVQHPSSSGGGWMAAWLDGWIDGVVWDGNETCTMHICKLIFEKIFSISFGPVPSSVERRLSAQTIRSERGMAFGRPYKGHCFVIVAVSVRRWTIEFEKGDILASARQLIRNPELLFTNLKGPSPKTFVCAHLRWGFKFRSPWCSSVIPITLSAKGYLHCCCWCSPPLKMLSFYIQQL